MIQKELENALPQLMVDDTDKDGHVEEVMDYIISWSLRCAMEHCKKVKPILHHNCKLLLCKILGLTDVENCTFTQIKTWKQKYNIDLWVEVILKHNGIDEFHSLLIEDKFYGQLGDAKDFDGEKRNQLIVYKHKFDEYYKSCTTNFKKHYSLITCIERSDPKFASYYGEVEKYGYIVFTYTELRSLFSSSTESDIFNEFWLRW